MENELKLNHNLSGIKYLFTKQVTEYISYVCLKSGNIVVMGAS